MHVLLTSVAGFIGSHVADALLAAGHQVHGIESRTGGDGANLAHLVGEPRFRWQRHDLRTPLPASTKLDAVVHIVGSDVSLDGLSRPASTLELAAIATRHALILARRHGARLLLVTSADVYGAPMPHALAETAIGTIDPLAPSNARAVADQYAEALAMSHHRVHGIDLRIARLFPCYGPRVPLDEGRFIPELVETGLTRGSLLVHQAPAGLRSLCFVSDAAQALVRLLELDPDGEQDLARPVNVGHATLSRMDEIVSALARALAEVDGITDAIPVQWSESALPPAAVRRPDTTRARALLHWEPEWSLDGGLRETVRWFRQRLVASGMELALEPHGVPDGVPVPDAELVVT